MPLPPKDGLRPWWSRDMEAHHDGGVESVCYDCGGDNCRTCDGCGRPVCPECRPRHDLAGLDAYPCPLAAMPDVPDTPLT